MKETGSDHWQSKNKKSTNSSGFRALPGGNEGKYTKIDEIGYQAYFWTGSEIDSQVAWIRNIGIDQDGDDGLHAGYSSKKYFLYSVRCIKN